MRYRATLMVALALHLILQNRCNKRDWVVVDALMFTSTTFTTQFGAFVLHDVEKHCILVLA